MSTATYPTEGLGLNERAIATMLSMLTQDRRRAPSLTALADQMQLDPAELRRLFANEEAVLAATVEQALVRLLDACVKSVVKIDPDDALGQFGVLGEAYLDWATTYREHFLLLSDSNLFDVTQHPHLARYMDSVRELMQRMLERARDAGYLPNDENIEMLVLTSRTYAYGLARMVIDDRMREWCPGQDSMTMARAALHDFLHRIARGSLPVLRMAERRQG